MPDQNPPELARAAVLEAAHAEPQELVDGLRALLAETPPDPAADDHLHAALVDIDPNQGWPVDVARLELASPRLCRETLAAGGPGCPWCVCRETVDDEGQHADSHRCGRCGQSWTVVHLPEPGASLA